MSNFATFWIFLHHIKGIKYYSIFFLTMVRFYLLFFLMFGCVPLLAQSADRQQLIDNSAAEYLRLANAQSSLFYGKEQEAHQRTINHPYLVNEHFAKAHLSYNEVIYPEVLLRLDLNRDELIIISPDFRQIVLTPENVDFVEMHGKYIVYFRRDDLPGCPSSGFYFLLHSGDCKVLEKQVNKMIPNDKSEMYFVQSTNFYLYKDGVYYTIRSKRGLLNALGTHRKELKRFISANRLSFRPFTELFLTLTVREYEKLSRTQ